MHKTVALTATVVLAIAGALGYHFATTPTQAPASSYVLLDGSTTDTSAFRGRVTLVNFWPRVA